MENTSASTSTRFRVEPVNFIPALEEENIQLNTTKDLGLSQLYSTVGPIDFRPNNHSIKTSRRPDRYSLQFDKNQKISRNRKISSVSNKPQFNAKSGNMVLQLVLSPETLNRDREENHCLTSSSSDSLSSNLIKLRDRSRLGSEAGSPQDAPLRNVNLNTYCATSRGFSECELPSPAFKVYSRNDQQKLANDEYPEPTSEEDKKNLFRKHLTIILSCIYGVFIVTLGLVIYISDIIIGNTALAETFSIYLLIIGFVYMVYLVVDIRLYVNKTKDRCTAERAAMALECREGLEGDLHLSVPLPSWSDMLYETLPHRYCFSRGRHSGSFYLKVGAAGFCLGHLIHSGLLLGYQIVFLTADGDAFYECASVATLVLDIIYPVYSFFLLYFIFKYSNVIINIRPELARFALMHCIASSLCFWIWTILREITDSLSHTDNHDDNSTVADDYSSSEEEDNDNSASTDKNTPIASALTAFGKTGAKELVTFVDEMISPKVGRACMDDSRLDVIYKNYSPYLYPFTVEYSILVVGVIFIIWQNIGKCQKLEEDANGYIKHCPSPGLNKENNFTSNLVIHVDCHSANTGLFCGILIMVCAIVSIILFFIAISNPKYVYLGVFVNNITELVFISLMTITAIWAYRKISKLDVNFHQVSKLDDLLLFISIPAFFLNAIFSIVPAVEELNGFSIASIILELIQILIQTPLIIDGLRRCSNSRSLRLEKPGRGLITFLIICNVAMWITETFEIKSHDLYDVRYAFYGKVWWTVIGHLTLPLTMFYRFHSSVCLVDIWKSAYEPGIMH